jgi:hypothetical protein
VGGDAQHLPGTVCASYNVTYRAGFVAIAAMTR